MRVLQITLAIVLSALTTTPFTAPSTVPSTAPARAGEEALDGGKVHFVPPAGWTLRNRADNDLSVQYHSPDGKSLLALVVVNEKQPLPDSAGEQIAPSLVRQLHAEAKKNGETFLTEPEILKDDRFFAKVHDRTKKGSQTNDRLHIYRQVGTTLLTIVCQAYTDKPDVASKMQDQATEMIAGATVGTEAGSGGAVTTIKRPAADAAGPTFLLKSHIRIDSPPSGWRSQKGDASGGIVCTYRELGGENGVIIVSLRQLPPEAKSDPKLRDALIDELLAGEKSALQMPGAKETEKPRTINDPRFIRKTAQKYDVQGALCDVVSRQIVVGNALMSVASFAPDERADQIDKLADAVATSAKPIGK